MSQQHLTTITVYTLPECPNCDKTFRILDRKDVGYTVIDISTDETALAKVKELGFSSAPIVVTPTDSWAGFRLDKLVTL